MLELAENANTYTALGPGEERVETDRYVIWFGPGRHPSYNVVQRLRLSADELEKQVEEIREHVRARGLTACTWEIASSATPADLTQRLLALGLVPDSEPHAVGMVLTEPPAAEDDGLVTARRVGTLDEMRAAIRIAAAAFGGLEEHLDEELARAPVMLAHQGERGAVYVAFLDGQPVARAYGAFTPHGVILFGGATLPEARGRWAYRALVRARWEDAVALGTPALVTHAGAMSRPILRRLGFREVAEIDILLDEKL